MGILERITQKKNFEREWEAYINGFYDDYDYLDEYNAGNKCDLTIEAQCYGIDVSSGYLAQSDMNKIKRYNKNK